MRLSSFARLLAGTVAVSLVAAAPATAVNVPAQPELLKEFYKQATDPSRTFFDAGQPLPAFNSCNKVSADGGRSKDNPVFNPSGVFNAFDTNVFEVLCLPYRGAGDEKDDEPEGNAPARADGTVPAGSTRNGFCGGPNTFRPSEDGAPQSAAAGECPNHQLEYIRYYKQTMREILGPFGVTFRDYEFQNAGSGNTEAGKAINPAAIVAGADSPDESIVIGAHYDKTTEGPASVWDSQEGHAQIIRVAKIMADYWTRTGSRPNATIKFIPWDGEESGTLGSLDYTQNNIVPGQEEMVRGYWNTDPCAGGYPAFRGGNPLARIALGIQTARVTEIPEQFDKTRVQAFNDAAPQIVEDVFDQLDDTVTTAAGPQKVFISKKDNAANADTADGGPVAIGTDRPVLFSSDWANFLNKGVPFFNPGPEVTGPSDTFPMNPNGGGNPDGLAILHTPRDNFETLNQQTGFGNGTTWSDGWMKGMEMCAQMLAWGMLREDQGGAQKTDNEVTAYYEALPNEARVGVPVSFDSGGTYQLNGPASLVDPSKFDYAWDFGDGTTGTGPKPQHTYLDIGFYDSKLTVTNRDSGKKDTMIVPITVLGASIVAPVLGETPAEDTDGTYDLSWTFDEAGLMGFTSYSVEEASNLRNVKTEPAETLDGVAVTPPTNPRITPWKLSKDAAPPGSFGGNLRKSGASSFYTGVAPDDQEVGTFATPGSSVLTFKEAVQLSRDSTLSYWSLFANNRADSGRVEVAEAVEGDLEWRTVDTVPYVNNRTPVSAPLRLRTADLSAFPDKKVFVRFVMALGSGGFINVARQGWYVDDITIDTGTFNKIGQPTAKTFTVADRPKGDYAYRVRGVSATGPRTPPGNVRFVKVTRADGGGTIPAPIGDPPPGGDTPGSNPPGGNLPDNGTSSGSGANPGGSPPATSVVVPRPPVTIPKPATRAIRASVTRRVLSGNRLRLACRLANAKVRTCTIRVLVSRRGKLRTIKTVRLTAGKSRVIALGKVRKVTLRGTVVSTAGKSFTAPSRTLTRR